MDGEADAVVGDAVVVEVAGADLLGAVAGADLGTAQVAALLRLLLLLVLVEARAQPLQGELAVLDLRALRLAGDDEIGRASCRERV